MFHGLLHSSEQHYARLIPLIDPWSMVVLSKVHWMIKSVHPSDAICTSQWRHLYIPVTPFVHPRDAICISQWCLTYLGSIAEKEGSWDNNGLCTFDVVTRAVWPVKSCQMSKKLPKNDFTRTMKDFDTFTKIAKNVDNLDFEKLPKVQ